MFVLKKKVFNAVMIVVTIITLCTFQIFSLFSVNVTTVPTEEDGSMNQPRIQQEQEGGLVPTGNDRRTTTSTISSSSFSSTRTDKSGPLNIIVIYPDDWRHDAIGDEYGNVDPRTTKKTMTTTGSHGSDDDGKKDNMINKNNKIYTPVLTKLAKEGIRFLKNYVTTSVCWMSRATYFTGQYASQHGSRYIACPMFTIYPKRWNGTWPYHLRTYGNYHVGHVGKWQYKNRNLGSSTTPNAFDFVELHEGTHWYSAINDKNEEVEVPAAEYSKQKTIQFLRTRPSDKPFAVTVAFYPPKAIGNDAYPLGGQWRPDPTYRKWYDNVTYIPPYNYTQAFEHLPNYLQDSKKEPRNRYTTRYETNEMYQASLRNYYSMVSHVDAVCGEIIDELKAQNVYNNTLIIVTADNGMMLGAHGLAGKWHPYEESIRVPLIIYDPRLPPSQRGTVDDESITLNIDLASTILGAAQLPSDPRMQGRDIADLYLSSDAHASTKQHDGDKQQESASTGIGKGDDNDDDPKKGKVDILSPMTTDSLASSSSSSWRKDFFYEYPLRDFPDSTALVSNNFKYMRFFPASSSGGQNKKKSTHDNYELLFDLRTDPYELNDLVSFLDLSTSNDDGNDVEDSNYDAMRSLQLGSPVAVAIDNTTNMIRQLPPITSSKVHETTFSGSSRKDNDNDGDRNDDNNHYHHHRHYYQVLLQQLRQRHDELKHEMTTPIMKYGDPCDGKLFFNFCQPNTS